ncbi:hypothetical protein SmJEL517_g04000 [Synchytrium microbalum]|uniref:Uncharacterized protein n=1 Tax=Synchytrium microbalum TaxID=1806994 RepID=A0A507C4U7_9FUNG|nr:uncharacterized protein SmJEL517_g04000 [Synchytrium microbalum]TPX33016.1 hypothetical protein SmJEL517_g04000 [Synchytrium microbalum]
MASSSSHPKIQLESKADIRFLTNELRRAATTSTETRATEIVCKTGGNAKQVKATKQAVNVKVEKWIDEVFALASNNLQINGVEYHEAFRQVQEFEPEDTNLLAQTEKARIDKDRVLVKVAHMRKEIPKKTRDLVQDSESRHSRVAVEKVPIRDVESLSVTDTLIAPRERIQAVQDAVNFIGLDPLLKEYDETVRMVADLVKPESLPATTSKLLRATKLLSVWEATSQIPDPSESMIKQEGDVTHSAGGMVGLDTPRKARSGLLKRLQANTRTKPY